MEIYKIIYKNTERSHSVQSTYLLWDILLFPISLISNLSEEERPASVQSGKTASTAKMDQVQPPDSGGDTSTTEDKKQIASQHSSGRSSRGKSYSTLVFWTDNVYNCDEATHMPQF